jgi:hypothetical protein
MNCPPRTELWAMHLPHAYEFNGFGGDRFIVGEPPYIPQPPAEGAGPLSRPAFVAQLVRKVFSTLPKVEKE